MKYVYSWLGGALVIIGILCIIFNLKLASDQNVDVAANTNALVPSLSLSNPRSVLQPGDCTADADCDSDLLHCLGNTCVLKPDAPLPQQCNEDNFCISAIVGLDSIGAIVNECIPTRGELFDRDNCNTKNPHTCIGGTISDGQCVPASGQSVLYFSTFGGKETIPVVLNENVAKAFLAANPTTLFTTASAAMQKSYKV